MRQDIEMISGDPDHSLEERKRWEAAGVDQIVIATGAQDHGVALETIRHFGEHVIPELDKNPANGTTKLLRAAAGLAAS